MIYCLYIKSYQKGFWHLFATSSSLEEITEGKEKVINQGKEEINFDIKVGIQQYENNSHIPEYIKELKDQKIAFD